MIYSIADIAWDIGCKYDYTKKLCLPYKSGEHSGIPIDATDDEIEIEHTLLQKYSASV